MIDEAGLTAQLSAPVAVIFKHLYLQVLRFM